MIRPAPQNLCSPAHIGLVRRNVLDRARIAVINLDLHVSLLGVLDVYARDLSVFDFHRNGVVPFSCGSRGVRQIRVMMGNSEQATCLLERRAVLGEPGLAACVEHSTSGTSVAHGSLCRAGLSSIEASTASLRTKVMEQRGERMEAREHDRELGLGQCQDHPESSSA